MARKALKKGKKPVTSKKKMLKASPTKKKVLFIPKGYNSITPYLIVSDGKKAIKFYESAFGAKQVLRMDMPDGKIAHAELKLGDAKIMLSDECPEMHKMGYKAGSSSAVSIHFYTKDVDQAVKKAKALGANIIKPVEDQFYGDRAGMIEDPFGHKWCVATHIENVTPAQLKKRAAALFEKQHNAE